MSVTSFRPGCHALLVISTKTVSGAGDYDLFARRGAIEFGSRHRHGMGLRVFDCSDPQRRGDLFPVGAGEQQRSDGGLAIRTDGEIGGRLQDEGRGLRQPLGNSRERGKTQQNNVAH